jgi:hypothetical protein
MVLEELQLGRRAFSPTPAFMGGRDKPGHDGKGYS